MTRQIGLSALVGVLISPLIQIDRMLAGGGIANARSELQKRDFERRLVAAWERVVDREEALATA